jgi:hypothetical protein
MPGGIVHRRPEIKEGKMNSTPAVARSGPGSVDLTFSPLNLTAESQLLRQKVKTLRQSNKVPQEMILHIESHLNAISQEPNLMKQWSHYELAYEGFISAGSPDDLLGVMLSLRSRSELLDVKSQEIWSKEKLGEIEDEVRRGTTNGTVREEIASLARAIYESGSRFVRSSGLQSSVLKKAILLNAFISVASIALLLVFQLKHVGPESAWHTLLIGCLGASGASLHAAIQLYQSHLEVDDLKLEPAMLVFRAVLGAVFALIVTLFLRLRVIDFPYLHTGPADTTPYAPAALYVFAFVSGFAEPMLFAMLNKLVRRDMIRRETKPVAIEQAQNA